MYPEFRKELRAKLLADATQAVLKQCKEKLSSYLQVRDYHDLSSILVLDSEAYFFVFFVQVAPYKKAFPDQDDEDYDTSHGVKVLAFSYTEDNTVEAVFLSRDGVPMGTLKLSNMMRSSMYLGWEDFEKKVCLSYCSLGLTLFWVIKYSTATRNIQILCRFCQL